MTKSTDTVISSDGGPLFLNTWLPDDQISGIVQIVHGMAEHSGRYERFARFLNSKGFAVYAHDHRGHGRSVLDGEVHGHIADKYGWDILIDDVELVRGQIEDTHPDIPKILFGHSMGSLVTICALQEYNADYKGWVLSSLPNDPGFLAPSASVLASLLKIFRPSATPAKLHDKIHFGGYNNAFKPNRTNFDWISSDNSEVDVYISDPWCGTVCSLQYYSDLMSGVQNAYRKNLLQLIDQDIPVLSFTGSKDPVTGGESGFKKSVKHFGTHLSNIKTKVYPDGRHELLNEVNRDEVMRDILDWMEEVLRDEG